MRRSDQSERLIGHARPVRLSRADHRRILRVQLTFRLGGLLLVTATSPVTVALRMDIAAVRIALFVIVYLGAEALLRRKTRRILAEIRELDADRGRPSSVDLPFRVAGAASKGGSNPWSSSATSRPRRGTP
jgi:hypothetical protein